MADVEAAARRALAEVRDAVSGYRAGQPRPGAGRGPFGAVGGGDRPALRRRPRRRCPARSTPCSAGWCARRRRTCCGTAGPRRSPSSSHADDGEVTLTVTDDGAGRRGAARAPGLAGLAERVEALGGRLAAGPADGARLPAGRRRSADRPGALPEPVASQ